MKLALTVLSVVGALCRLAIALGASAAWLGVANHLHHARSGVPLGAMALLGNVLIAGLLADVHGVLVSVPGAPLPLGRRDVHPMLRLMLYVGGLILTAMVVPPTSVPVASRGVRCFGLLCGFLAMRVALGAVDAFSDGPEEQPRR